MDHLVVSTSKLNPDEVDTDVETPLNSPERDSFVSPNTSTDSSEVCVLVNVEVESGETVEITTSTDDDEAKYTDWPLEGIKDPHPNDVLYGRGGGTNHHPGNKRYRRLVEDRKVDYVNSKRLDKPLVALEIIKGWRSQKPSGRFLKIDDETGLWHDVGDKKAREKTSQALREKAPLLRKQQEEIKRETEEIVEPKNTRFDVPPEKRSSTGRVNSNLSRVVLARDHSLGRDYIAADDPVSLRGFSWNETAIVDEEASNTAVSQSNSWGDHSESQPYVYAVRDSGSNTSRPTIPDQSSSAPFPTYSDHIGYAPPPPLQDKTRVGSSALYPGQTHYPVPPPLQDTTQAGYRRDWSTEQYPHNSRTPQTHSSMMHQWRGYHSDNIMKTTYGANESGSLQPQSADIDYQRNRHGHYRQIKHQPANHLQSDEYSNGMHSWASVGGGQQQGSYEKNNYYSPDKMHSTYSQVGGWISPNARKPSPTFSANSSSLDTNSHRFESSEGYARQNSVSREGLPRPQVVKRDTSNKLKPMDFEPTKKRMNRQSSMSSLGEINESDMRHLNDSLELSCIANAKSTHPLMKPPTMKPVDRLSTIDRIIVDLEGASSPFDIDGRPTPLSSQDRIDTLGTIDSDILKDLAPV